MGARFLVANTAQFLAMSGRKVVALDLDLEAPGLHQKLGSREVMSRAAAGTLRGAVDELLDILEKEPGERNPAIAFEEVNLPSGTSGSLRLIPAGSAPSQNYWAALERLNRVLRTRSRDGGLPEAILELQARIEEQFAPDFLLIDSRTGITELGGLATSLLADRVVCLTTTAPESIEGTKVVADALRKAPRLSSQQPLLLDFLMTRVVSGSGDNVSRLMKELGCSAKVLPHDSGIAKEERVWSGWRPGQADALDARDDSGEELFSATLKWIAESFPGQKEVAERARRRMMAVNEAWKYLTAKSQRSSGWIGWRKPWPLDQLRERVRFGSGNEFRQADIVVYDSPREDAKPLMIIEYVDGEDCGAEHCDEVARCWCAQAEVPVVVVLSEQSQRLDYRTRRIYSCRRVWVSGREGWDARIPFRAMGPPVAPRLQSPI